MSKPISVGDLVMVIRSCCERTSNYIGFTFIAGPAIYSGVWPCKHCDHPNTTGRSFSSKATRTLGAGDWAEWRLKRIPPLEELESEKQKEDMREPA